MDTALKQRLVGAAVLVALAVIFLPMLVKGPAPDSGVSDVSMDIPAAPESAMETRELPLVRPGAVPAGGAVGLDARPVDLAVEAPTAAPAEADTTADPAASPSQTTAPALPATTAGGGYAVHFGAYASAKAADTVVALAKEGGLPAYSEATQLGSRQAWRVRIGPYATRAEAEIVRVKALEVRNDVPVRVVTLDAAAAAPLPTETPTAAASTVDTKPVEAKPVDARPSEKPVSRPEARPEAKPADATRVAAKPEPPKPTVVKPAPPKPAPASASTAKVGFAVQLGAFADAAEAEALRQRLRGAGFAAFTERVETDKGRLTRVSVGPALDRAEADRLKAQIQAKTGLNGFVRSHP